jgi:hypothetical protein
MPVAEYQIAVAKVLAAPSGMDVGMDLQMGGA